MQQKTALITGVTGQDGAYLSEFLLKKNKVINERYNFLNMTPGFYTLKVFNLELT